MAPTGPSTTSTSDEAVGSFIDACALACVGRGGALQSVAGNMMAIVTKQGGFTDNASVNLVPIPAPAGERSSGAEAGRARLLALSGERGAARRWGWVGGWVGRWVGQMHVHFHAGMLQKDNLRDRRFRRCVLLT